MNTWIETKTTNLPASEVKGSTGPRNLRLTVSPYDVPDAVRACSANDQLIIELRYININENHSSYSGQDDGISFEIGDKTKRIYKIFINTNIKPEGNFEFLIEPAPIESAIDYFIEDQPKNKTNKKKYDATLAAIRNSAESLKKSIIGPEEFAY